MSTASRAIFISYASQDAEVARRIAEALRSVGIEVWFDQSELVGGDAWDAKIRQQIKECALFVPVISANTNARLEGYFRIEWKLAAHRTHAMAEEKTFLLPVVIDDTRDFEAKVPVEFRAVQWTWLSHQGHYAAFGDRVKHLLADAPPSPRQSIVEDAPTKAPAASLRGLRRQLASVAVGVSVVFALGLWWKWPERSATPQDPVARPVAAATAPRAPRETKSSAASDKSVAVLPFENRSSDPENAFFADGVHDNLLAQLTNIGELRVISTDSVERYRESKKALSEIARELHVTWLLKGSVQRVDQRVRVTCALIRAESGEQIWTQPFDRHLSDIFAIQTELAQAIAVALKAKISPQEQTLITRAPTQNLAAYELYLRAQAERRGNNRAFDQREKWLQEAITLDPNFASAWAELAWIHSLQYLVYPSTRVAQSRLEKARTAIDHAIRLAPDAPDVRLSLGYFHYGVFRDYARALHVFDALAREQPNAWAPRMGMANVQRRQGRWIECLANFNRAHELDPGNVDCLRQIVEVTEAGRRFDEAIAARKKLGLLSSEDGAEEWQIALLHFHATGSVAKAEALLDRADAEHPGRRLAWATVRGDYGELRRVEAEGRIPLPYVAVLAIQGDLPEARRRLDSRMTELRARVARELEDFAGWRELAEGEAMLGRSEDALKCARRALEIMPETLDAQFGARARESLAFVYAWSGDKEGALREYASLLRTTYSGLNVHEMRKHPRFAPLQRDPRFEALLNDPKNNAPLF